MPTDEVLTVDEVARYLRVHPMTVQRWCRTGELPAAKIGRAYRIKRAELDRWWMKHSAGEQSSHANPDQIVDKSVASRS